VDMPCSPTVDLMGLQYIFSVAYILARKHHLMKIIIVISGKKTIMYFILSCQNSNYQCSIPTFELVKVVLKLFVEYIV